ncbi:prepilin peptidase [Massilia antarctica]|uniref:prepilin peptidase n=1 Tax=Massilia antarctica TaxID=2765360 RepID=UPI0006BB8C33|nr:A24 family peptidase [Massilia sp. H27-R4]MCY0912998.1 A24 family peptidase [Massilia sp. H27-R4]CUI07578.1 Leader peptidase (Prepilin peptidase) / N-methyltransferase [Janthinobacterium sp. CG23_2]CUU31364.1 Leader peptidase (Prepilin peptidase) / N-methyltransferase [Janthinobacterium sp. CG23_2]
MLPETLLFAAPGSLGPALAAGLFGLLIGSFLNVVIYRLPKILDREYNDYLAGEYGCGCGTRKVHTDKFSLWAPRSACPHCGHHIGALENIPVISYLVLGGKCKGCKARISPRYPIIELVTGLMSALLVWHFGSGYTGLATLVFGYLLLSMTFIDADTQLLPDELTYPLLWIGLLMNINGSFVPLQDAVIGAAAGYLSLWSVATLYEKLRGQVGMGHGDFKLLAGLGAWMGWTVLPSVILISSAVGSVVGICLIVFGGQARNVKIPFGPYLAAAGFIVMLYGKPIGAMTGILLQYWIH